MSLRSDIEALPRQVQSGDYFFPKETFDYETVGLAAVLAVIDAHRCLEWSEQDPGVVLVNGNEYVPAQQTYRVPLVAHRCLDPEEFENIVNKATEKLLNEYEELFGENPYYMRAVFATRNRIMAELKK